jgi:chemotaxis protein MotA
VKDPRRSRPRYATIFGIVAALGIVAVAQKLEGAPVRALWQPTAALVVFGGTLAAVCVSYPMTLVRRTIGAVRQTFVSRPEPAETIMAQLVRFAHAARRRGLIALETELDRVDDPFVRAALVLTIDGTNTKNARQILEIESDARREHEEAPAEVLETAAGYSPTLGILGAVLGLIHVMSSIGEPSKLGSGIAVAFVATVYGLVAANLVLLPLATRMRATARQHAIDREIVIEGMVSVQEGLHPRLIEQKLRGFLLAARREDFNRKVA